MNKRFTLLTIATFLCSALAASAQDQFCNEKRTHRHYDHVNSATDTLMVNNSFGSVTINTWDRDEIDISIVIVGLDTNAAKAQKLLAAITLEANASDPKKIICTTTTDYGKLGVLPVSVSGRPERWSANCAYTISMPKSMALYIKTSNAEVTLGDYDGALDVNINGGHITAGNLTGPSTNIYVNRSEGYENKIGFVKDGEINCADACCALNLAKKADKKKVTMKGWAPLVIDGRTQ